jgi:hypothetical protein
MMLQIAVDFSDLDTSFKELDRAREMLRLYQQAKSFPLIQDVDEIAEPEKAVHAISRLGKSARLVFRAICDNIVNHGRATLEDVSAQNSLSLDTVRAYHRNGMRSAYHRNAKLPFDGVWSPTENRVIYTAKDITDCKRFLRELDLYA